MKYTVAIIFIIVTSCKVKNNNLIIGTWQSEKQKYLEDGSTEVIDTSFTFKFNQDGSVIIWADGDEYKNKYIISKDTLKMGTDVYLIKSLTEKKMVIEQIDLLLFRKEIHCKRIRR